MRRSGGASRALRTEVGLLRAQAEAAGRPMSLGDAQVAATARCHGATIATRNTGDYEVTGPPLVDPFDAR